MQLSSSDGCTGGSSGEVEQVTFTSRLTYLSINFFFIVLNLGFGYVVYESTKSLTVEVDFLSFACEVLAVLINIVIEVVKRRALHARKVMILDLVGGLSSLALLVVVGFFGVYSAVSTSAHLAKGAGSAPAVNTEEILEYSSFSLGLSVLNLGSFLYLKAKMLPQNGDVNDQLNIMSNLAHSIVDFVTNFAVLGTSLWLQFGVKEANWFEMRKNKVWVDVFGSFMVCACILVSIVWLLRDILQAAVRIREMPSAAEDCFEKRGINDYGSTKHDMVKHG